MSQICVCDFIFTSSKSVRYGIIFLENNKKCSIYLVFVFLLIVEHYFIFINIYIVKCNKYNNIRNLKLLLSISSI